MTFLAIIILPDTWDIFSQSRIIVYAKDDIKIKQRKNPDSIKDLPSITLEVGLSKILLKWVVKFHFIQDILIFHGHNQYKLFSELLFHLASISLKLKIFEKIHTNSFEILCKNPFGSHVKSFYLQDLRLNILIGIVLNF